MVPSHNPLATYPSELIDRVACSATTDADLTAYFLQEVGLASPAGTVRRFPAEFLLELGAAMRLLAWEVDGLDLHEAGLPTARDAIEQVFRDALHRLRNPSHPVPSLGRAVFRIGIERLAWVGPRNLHAEILLDFPNEDALVEAMAQFLWNHRGPASPGNERIGL